MGRWSGLGKTTVEETKSISVFWLNRNGYFCGFKWGGMRWTNSLDEEMGSVGFNVSVEDTEGYIQFQYTYTNSYSGQKENLDYKVKLVSTPCHFGGRRWWFICPLVVNGMPCNRRVGVLYLGGKYFGCRHCYDLTYKSSQEHDKRIDNLIKNPELLPALLKNKNLKNKFLAFRASLKLLKRI